MMLLQILHAESFDWLLIAYRTMMAGQWPHLLWMREILLHCSSTLHSWMNGGVQ